MNKGTGFLTAGCGAQVELRCTGDFHAFVCDSERNRLGIAGPWREGARNVKFYLPEDCDTVEVCCAETDSWQGLWRARPPINEHNSGVSKAEPIETELSRDEMLRQMVQKAVATAIQSQNPEIPSLEEEDDFEVEDEEEDIFGLSQYEVKLMVDEYIAAKEELEPSPAKPSSGLGQSEYTENEDGQKAKLKTPSAEKEIGESETGNADI